VFERVELRVRDFEASRRFYATVLGALPLGPTQRDADGRALAWGDFALAPARDGEPATRGLHLGFSAPSHEAVDAFWQAGLRAGHREDGPPGLRPQYVADYYGAFLLDPDGNSAEAVHHGGVRGDGTVDHLWIRVADLAAARSWYAALAPAAGWHVRDSDETRVRVEGPGPAGSFALVADGQPPTAAAHLAVVASDPARAETYRDPDGNRVELLAPPPR
jgi:catechol 2,3-dioxygenase-like lactoylglutathione lyase family enzyme